MRKMRMTTTRRTTRRKTGGETERVNAYNYLLP